VNNHEYLHERKGPLQALQLVQNSRPSDLSSELRRGDDLGKGKTVVAKE
jgi:hypothetical protein